MSHVYGECYYGSCRNADAHASRSVGRSAEVRAEGQRRGTTIVMFFVLGGYSLLQRCFSTSGAKELGSFGTKTAIAKEARAL